jgi:uracil-DNA glycosylase
MSGTRRPPVSTAAPLIRAGASLPELRAAAAGCQACPLWQTGTQTVFGEGRVGARLLFVGEQPGHEEDQEGRPFVGPAGRLLDAALADAGIDRAEAYVTNVVKHFKWEARGKRRIHQKPNQQEIDACRPWLEAEVAALGPRVIACLGATAAQALLGKQFRVTRDRGKLIEGPLGIPILATVHPSAVLRAPGGDERARMRGELVADLRVLARALA